MKIALKCPCGAEASWESDERLPAEVTAELGMEFLVERIAREWQYLHVSCGYHVTNVSSMWTPDKPMVSTSG